MIMLRNILLFLMAMSALLDICDSCLITNCPRGGKRSGRSQHENNIKQCISCGPGRSGQCFGSNICCGPFGCLMGTSDTIRCHREGYFQDSEPCIAGNANCRKNTGRCAGDGICCSQESCHVDKNCATDEKFRTAEFVPESLYNIFPFPNQVDYTNEINAV